MREIKTDQIGIQTRAPESLVHCLTTLAIPQLNWWHVCPPLINDIMITLEDQHLWCFTLTVPGVGHSTKCCGFGEFMMDYSGFKMSVWSFIIIPPCYRWIMALWYICTKGSFFFLRSIISGTNTSLTTYALDEGSSSGFLYPGAFLFLI